MLKLWNRLKSNSYLVSFSVLASGSVLAQVIGILLSPITTRLFTPEQFGFYTLITTAVSLFGPIICLKYDMAIVVSKTERDTYSIICLCLLLCIPLSFVIGIIYGIAFITNNSTGIFYIITIIILLALYGINNILLAHNNRNGLYKLISSVTIIKSVVNNILFVIVGLLGFGVPGLVGSQIISSFVGLNHQSQDIKRNINKVKEIDLSSIKKMLFLYKKQPVYNASSALITTSVYSSINLFINSVYSVEQLGLYSLSYRIFGIPFAVISANIARIFFDNAAKEKLENGNYEKTFKKTLYILSITIIPLITFTAIVSPWFFSFIFGKKWGDAGLFIRLLAPMFAIRLVSESLTTSFIVSGKQHIELIFQSILFIGELLVYSISFIGNLSIEQFLLLISLLYLISYGSMIIIMYKLSKETGINVGY